MDEAERLADRIAILDHGTLLALDTPAGLTREQSTTTTEVRFQRRPGLESGALGAAASARRRARKRPASTSSRPATRRALLVELTHVAARRRA